MVSPLEQLQADKRAADQEIARLRKLIVPSIRRNLADLHPKARGAFEQLEDYLQEQHRKGVTKTLFKVFEAFRTPERQYELYRKVPRVTKAEPWESAHNYGLAVDFVPLVDGLWNWHDKNDWDFLHRAAVEFGLRHPITWDRPHIEHPLWSRLQPIV